MMLTNSKVLLLKYLSVWWIESINHVTYALLSLLLFVVALDGETCIFFPGLDN